ncbi:MAG: TonB family protein [Ramlibacter sp.]|jgi:protein TonB|nr:TonB family protein [Ramlibacter sp.]
MSNFAPSSPRVPTVSRNVLIAGSVLVLHGAALWALQSGLVRRAVEVVVPVEILSSIVTPPAPVQPPAPPAPPVAAPPSPPPPKPRPVVQRPRPRPPAPVPAPAPRPVAAPSPAPAPQAPVGVAEPQPPAPPITAPMTAAPPPAPAPAPAPPPVVELPSTNADYLQNPPVAYPPASKRLREQGTVLLHVRISAQGTALEVQLKRSSGYDRLDRAALEAVRGWRFVPGKRGGVPETMWFDVPVNFVWKD